MSDRELLEKAAKAADQPRTPDCKDLDEDCQSVCNKIACWLHAPERGMCPYLRGAAARREVP